MTRRLNFDDDDRTGERGPSRRPRVWVAQRSMHRDHDTGEFVPKFPDLEQRASEFGDVVYVLQDRCDPTSGTAGVVDECHEKLCVMRPDDYLLLVGNPTLIAIVAAIAAHYLDGQLRCLQFSGGKIGMTPRYVPIEIDLQTHED